MVASKNIRLFLCVLILNICSAGVYSSELNRNHDRWALLGCMRGIVECLLWKNQSLKNPKKLELSILRTVKPIDKQIKKNSVKKFEQALREAGVLVLDKTSKGTIPELKEPLSDSSIDLTWPKPERHNLKPHDVLVRRASQLSSVPNIIAFNGKNQERVPILLRKDLRRILDVMGSEKTVNISLGQTMVNVDYPDDPTKNIRVFAKEEQLINQQISLY